MRLKKDAVPSVFSFQKNCSSTVQCEPEESPRVKRFKKRETEPSCSSVQYEVEIKIKNLAVPIYKERYQIQGKCEINQ